jgi:DNA-binding CsgD family transcriptional regulator
VSLFSEWGVVTSQIDVELLAKAAARMEEAVIDPATWTRVLDDLCAATGSTGAVLFQGDVRTPDVPSTASMKESLRVYFGNNWHTNDLRALRGVPRVLAGDVVVIDQDMLTPEEMLRDPMHNETLFPFGFYWYAGIGFWAEKALWALVLQRTKREGPFEGQDKASLATLSPRMSEVATLSTAVGRVALSGITNVLDLMRRPALVLDRRGYVLHANAQAEAGFDDDLRIRDRRLLVRDGRAAAQIDRLVQMICSLSDAGPLSAESVVIRRTHKRSVILRVLPVPGATRNVFLGARALLVLDNLLTPIEPEQDILTQALDLTPAEARLAALLSRGLSVEAAATELRIAQQTARNQLKSVFAKTGTHRQSELVSLIAQFM